MDLNTVTVVGTVVDVPEIREVGHREVVDFQVAVEEHVKRDDERTTDLVYVPVAAWGKQGRACLDLLSLDSQVGITGRLTNGPEVDEPEGSPVFAPRAGLRVVADRVKFLSPVREAVAA